jgi:hypothetical protein
MPKVGPPADSRDEFALDPFRRFGPAYETEPPIDGDYGLFRKTNGWKWVIQPLLTVERTVERAPRAGPCQALAAEGGGRRPGFTRAKRPRL